MTDPERSHTFFPGGQISEAGFRYANLYPYIVKLLSIAYSGEHPQPPPRFYPQSFDEIYSMREQLAAFNISMGRDQADQKAYYAFIKTAGNPEQLIIEKYFGGEIQYQTTEDLQSYQMTILPQCLQEYHIF